MEWLSDYVTWLLDLGFVGIPLLGISALLVLIAVAWVLNGAVAAGRAFSRGWREAGERQRSA